MHTDRFRVTELCAQLDYLLTDKTGTLTLNKMALLKFSAAGVKYGTNAPSCPREYQNITSVAFPFRDLRVSHNKWLQLEEEEQQHIRSFLTALALCNTVMPNKQGDEISFGGGDPDETALVSAANWVH